MPRKSRVKDNYGTYHIRQRGSGLTRLFADAEDRDQFLEILRLAGEKNNFQVMAYCVSNADQYDLILDSNGCDISKVMKEINIRYSIYKQCEGCLFKDRFQSELLSSAMADPQKSQVEGTAVSPMTDFSSCSEFLKHIAYMTVLDETSFESMPGSLQCTYQRGCQERIETVEAAAVRLADQLKELGIDFSALKKDKPLRNQMINQMKACSTLSLREIGTVFGGLSESSVSKIVNARPHHEGNRQ